MKTDQQIADQITRHIDQLSLTTSYELINVILIDQSQDKSLLISQILQTKLGS